MTFDFQSIANRLAIPAMSLDPEGVIGSANAAMAECVGRGANALIGGKLSDCVVDQVALAEFLSSNDLGPCEFRLRGDDTPVRVVAFSVALRDARGILLTAFNLTSLRAEERELRETCDRYLDMATAGSDALHEVELPPNEARGAVRIISVRRVNDKPVFREAVQNWPDDVIDMSFDPEGMERYFATVRAGKPYQDIVWRMRRDDHREVYVRTSAVPYRGPDGEVRGYRGIGVNVTGQVLAERAFKESQKKLAWSQEHLARAQHVARAGSIERDFTTGAVSWSDGFHRLLGTDPSQFEPGDANLFSLIHEEDRNYLRQILDNALKGIAPEPGELRVVRPDGTIATLCFEAELVCDENGKPLRLLSIVKDVTELRARILELEEAREHLQRQRRELEIAAANLMEARDSAEQASQSKSAFLANMSHELRTPLNAIIGFSEMISGGYFGEVGARYKSYAIDIHTSGHLLLELINQILDLSKVEAGRMELQESLFAPGEAVASCYRLLGERADFAGVTLLTEISPALPQLRADELKFKQIVLNLISNAIKFTPAGGKVRVAMETCASGLTVRVSDTGVGMSAEDIPHALEPFRQVGDDRRRKQQGTGLGLPLAKAFVELHGGCFDIASELHKGTTVTVVFPADRLGRVAAMASFR